ncbi:response regulator [Catenuloplanes sp. NPDC051500]|uniref:response regulator n=1 Tax=Catenuloplanes sp. NPDC051500 TaxID=3363959 RepID=UPI0037887BAE
MGRRVSLAVVVDDDADIRHIMGRVLRRGGHQVVEAENGAVALEAVFAHRPDVVVSDIDMPVMNGVELCQAIRAEPEFRQLPVVFVSGSLLIGDRRPAEGQATMLLAKPFGPPQLLSCVERALADGHQDGQAPVLCR